jgi:hypothetical protein
MALYRFLTALLKQKTFFKNMIPYKNLILGFNLSRESESYLFWNNFKNKI